MLPKEYFVKQKWIPNWSKKFRIKFVWVFIHPAQRWRINIRYVHSVLHTARFFTKLQRARKLCGVFAGWEGESQEVRSLVKEKSLWR